MPVQNTHCQFDEALPKWNRMRAVLAGEDAVKNAREAYLPMLGGQSAGDYDAYRCRALFFNATTRTRDGFAGMIFRKPPAMKLPESLKPLETDCDMAGQTFGDYMKAITDEVIGVGRAGTLIDYNDTEARPYLGRYQAEQIINWRFERINGRHMLSLLVLSEEADPMAPIDSLGEAPAATEAKLTLPFVTHGQFTGPMEVLQRPGAELDEFAEKYVDQIRVYRLTQSATQTEAATVAGQSKIVPTMEVLCDVYRKLNEKKEFELIGSITPKRKGKPLPEIPFVFHGPRDAKPEIERPPLEDIAQINLSHYRSSADLEHGRHFTGLPTAWVAGFPKDTELKIGSSVAWVSTDPTAKAAFLEFTGQGLSALKEALEQKEGQMAVLGARMLDAPKKAAETAEAMTIRASGEGSVLTNIAGSLSQSFTLVLKWALWWQGTADKKLSDIGDAVSVVLNTDFSALKLDAPAVIALVKTWQGGAMSLDSLVYVLKQGEYGHPDRSVQDEIDLIMTEKMPERALPPAPAPGKTKA